MTQVDQEGTWSARSQARLSNGTPQASNAAVNSGVPIPEIHARARRDPSADSGPPAPLTRPVGCAASPARCTRRRSSSTTNNTYSRLSPTVSTAKNHTPACRRPACAEMPSNWDRWGAAPGRAGADAGSAAPRRPMHRCRACGTPHDPQVSPPRVLTGHPQHQIDDLRINAPLVPSGGRIGPAASHQLPMPPH
jgi:hypothetical protein